MPPPKQFRVSERMRPSAAPIPKRRRHEEVVEHIELLVFSNRIGIGGRLPSERELMERFGVGRATVREALFKLNRMGLVEVVPGLPARVTRPTAGVIVNELGGAARHFLAAPEGMKHFQHARQLFEVGLAREAASHASDERVKLLAKALRENRASIGDQSRFVETDLEFHFVLARITDNPIFTSLMTAVSEWLGNQRAVSAHGGATQSEAYAQHASIFQAISKHDPERAGRAMQTHLESVAERYWRAITDAGTPVSAGDRRKSSKG